MKRIGYEFPPHSFTVERSKIKEFVQAIGDDNPIYTDREAALAAGYKDIVAPPTFFTVMDNWEGIAFEDRCRELEINPLKVLHGEQAYEFFADLYPGDVLVATTKVIDEYEKEGRSGKILFLVIAKEYKRDDQTVAICRSTTVVRS